MGQHGAPPVNPGPRTVDRVAAGAACALALPRLGCLQGMDGMCWAKATARCR